MTSVSIARAFERGLEHQRAGRLTQAEAVYREILRAVPGHPDALHMLGVIAHQSGRNDIALGLIDSAIGASPGHPGYHAQRGVVLHALGRVDDAVASYRRAVELKPDYAEARNRLAIALRAQGNLEGAAAEFRAALAARPDYAEAHNNLGNVLRDLGRFDEAVGCYGRALALRPDSPAVLANLGNALYALGRVDAALASYARALARSDDAPGFRGGFVQCLKGARFDGADPGFESVARDVRRLAVRALSEPWARPADLAGACIRLIARDPPIGILIARANEVWPERLSASALLGAEGLAALSGDALLRTLLENTQACDIALERLLTMARQAVLELAESDTGEGAEHADGGVLAFACALAMQCYINDYVFATTEAEDERAARLRERLGAALRQDAAVAELMIAAVACYFPLATLPAAGALVGRAWSGPVAALLPQQVAQPQEEARLREAMRRLTPIEDEVSLQVRQQYEEHRYPRWIKSPPQAAARSIGEHLRALFPAVPFAPIDESRGLDILIAGCGTGQESIETARQFPSARVLAIDLSLASLAFAERKARELGIRNLEHAQADILRLDSIGRTFDVIAAAGVLHHLADPLAGWRKLASLLRPGGLMRLGLYSERGRAPVVAARRYIAKHGYTPTATDIRRCRQDLMSAGNGRAFADLARLRDFYSTGECRDLLFHVQEHRYTLPQIGEMLDVLGLRFLGFLLDPAVAAHYVQRHPEDRAGNRLESWDAFETEFPAAFAGMYVFWVQKAT